jgi:hypothetical protein
MLLPFGCLVPLAHPQPIEQQLLSNAEEVQCILTMASCLFELCKDNPTCGLLHQPIVASHNIILVAEGEESTDSIL